MINPLHNFLNITVCEDAADAVAKGFDWAHPKPGEQPVKPVHVAKVVVVRKGTELGNPTVDFVLEDEAGQRYVFMVTGRLLKAIPCGA